MKKAIALSWILIVTLTTFAQNFEGKITYANKFKSKLPAVTDEQVAMMMGSVQQYYIKGGSYKSVTNGAIKWQLYVNQDNKLYTNMDGVADVLWLPGDDNTDSIEKIEVHKGVAEILGYQCDEVILTSKTGKKTFYFNSKLGVDYTLFKNHLFGGWYDFVKTSKALPLKMIIEDNFFTMESVATDIKAMKLEYSFFLLAPGTKTKRG